MSGYKSYVSTPRVHYNFNIFEEKVILILKSYIVYNIVVVIQLILQPFVIYFIHLFTNN